MFIAKFMQIECLMLVIGSAILAPALMIGASSVYRSVVLEVNADKPLEQRISGENRTRILQTLRQHEHAFPESRKRLLVMSVGLLGIVTFLVFAISAVVCFGSVT